MPAACLFAPLPPTLSPFPCAAVDGGVGGTAPSLSVPSSRLTSWQGELSAMASTLSTRQAELKECSGALAGLVAER